VGGREWLIFDLGPREKGQPSLRNIDRRIQSLERFLNIIIGLVPGLLQIHKGLSDSR